MPPSKPKIAVFSGPTSTIANSPPLVTSNKARLKYGLAPRPNSDGSAMRFDVLRPQRLAAHYGTGCNEYVARAFPGFGRTPAQEASDRNPCTCASRPLPTLDLA